MAAMPFAVAIVIELFHLSTVTFMATRTSIGRPSLVISWSELFSKKMPNDVVTLPNSLDKSH